MAKKRLRIKDSSGNVVQYDVAASDVTLQDGTDVETAMAGLGAGTVKGVKMNGAEMPENDGVVDLGTVVTEHQSLAALFGKIAYDNSTHRINFYGKDDTSMTTVLGYIDCSPFIVDGMLAGVDVKNVSISGVSTLCMVFSFNTDAGQQDINIPVSAIFDASQYYTKSQADGVFQVKLVSGTNIKTVNNESILGEGNISIPKGEDGDDGKSAYEIAVEEGFVGSKSDWLASLIGSCNITGDGSNIIALIVNDLVTGGAGNILSAEMGKHLGQQILAGTGTYAEAFNKSKTFSSFFPWLLDDVDDDGNRIRKMIWHIGNQEFIDAIGSVITGKKDGITIVSDGNGVLELYGGGYEGVIDRNPNTQPVGSPAKLHFSAGETNFGFDDIKNAFIEENQTLYETAVANTPSATPTTMDKIYTAIKNYDGKTLACSAGTWSGSPRNSVFDVKVDSEDDNKATYVDIDFGGVVIKGATAYHGNTQDAGYVDIMMSIGSATSNKNSLIRDVKRLIVECDILTAFSNCPNLRNVEIQGYVSKSCRIAHYVNQSVIETLDLSNFELKDTCTRLTLLSGYAGTKPITSIDLRKFDTSSVTSFNDMFGNCANLKTIIIGNFSNASATAVDKFLVYGNRADMPYTGVTLVCTTDEPPVLNSQYDWVANHFSTIKVPNKTIEVDGEEVTVLSRYQEAAGWSTYADIMETYEDGEY